MMCRPYGFVSMSFNFGHASQTPHGDGSAKELDEDAKDNEATSTVGDTSTEAKTSCSTAVAVPGAFGSTQVEETGPDGTCSSSTPFFLPNPNIENILSHSCD